MRKSIIKKPITIINDWLVSKSLWNESKQTGKLSIFNNSSYTNDFLAFLFNVNEDSIVIEETFDQEIEFKLKNHTNNVQCGLTCISCGLSFDDKFAQVFHFKSELHRFNLQRKLRGLDRLTESEFANTYKEVVVDSQLCVKSEENEMSDEENGDTDDSKEEHEDEKSVGDDNFKYTNETSYGSTMKQFSPKFGSLFTLQNNKIPQYDFVISTGLFSVGSSLQSKSWTQNDEIWIIMYKEVLHIRTNPMHAIFLLRSGRFAAAVYDSDTMLVHKILRRYTVRAKAGGGQSSHDNKGGKARSAGAMLRRYGEQALQEDINSLLNLWIGHIQCCSIIFIAAPKTMRSHLFDTSALSKDDSRISYIPFSVDKPTLEEVKSVHERCTTIIYKTRKLENSLSSSLNKLDNENQIPTTITIPDCLHSSKDVLSKTTILHLKAEDDFIQHPITKQIIDASCTLDENDAILAIKSIVDTYLQSRQLPEISYFDIDKSSDVNDEIVDKSMLLLSSNLVDVLNMPDSLEELRTPLHYYSELGMSEVVLLLLKLGASPMVLDIRGRRPYYLSKDKETRDMYRRYRSVVGESKYDWDATGVGSALSKEMERNQKQKDKDKKKRANQKKKENKIKEELYVLESQRLQQEEKTHAITKANENSIQMKIKAGNCGFCDKSLYNIPALDIYDRRCCSTDCVLKLRRKLQADAAMKRFGSSSS